MGIRAIKTGVAPYHAILKANSWLVGVFRGG